MPFPAFPSTILLLLRAAARRRLALFALPLCLLPGAAAAQSFATICPSWTVVNGAVNVSWLPLPSKWLITTVGVLPQCNNGQAIPTKSYNGIIVVDQPFDAQPWCSLAHKEFYGQNTVPMPDGFRDAGPIGFTQLCSTGGAGSPTNTSRADCVQETCVSSSPLPMVNAASFGASEAYGETERRDNGGGTFGTSPNALVSAFAWLPKTVPSGATGPLCDPKVGNSIGNLTVTVRDFAGNMKRACMLYAGTDLDDTASDRGLKLRYPGQINFLMPPEMVLNPDPSKQEGATVFVTLNTQSNKTVNEGGIPVRTAEPGLFVARPFPHRFPAAYYTRVRADQSQVTERVDQPLDLGPEGDQVFLVLYGTGVRGYPAKPGDQRRFDVSVKLEPAPRQWGADGKPGAARPTIPYEIALPVFYAGAQNDFLGLDQINVLVPRDLIRNMGLTGTSYAKVVLEIDAARDPGTKPGPDGKPDRTTNSVDIVLNPVGF